MELIAQPLLESRIGAYIDWTSIVTHSHYWILGKNVDLLGSPLGCAQQLPPVVACFRGV